MSVNRQPRAVCKSWARLWLVEKGFAEPGFIVLRLSTWLLEKFLSKSLLALSALGNMVLYFFLASYLAVTYSELDSSGDLFSLAMLGSTLDTCSASVRGAFWTIFKFFYVAVDSNPVACVSFLTQNGEVCSANA